MEYDYKVHQLTVFRERFNGRKEPCFTSETDELLRSIEKCLCKADRLDLKIVGLKLNEAREALKADPINE